MILEKKPETSTLVEDITYYSPPSRNKNYANADIKCFLIVTDFFTLFQIFLSEIVDHNFDFPCLFLTTCKPRIFKKQIDSVDLQLIPSQHTMF